jgi:pyruvate dehydrogenase E2 component (dihydrolipoamide acetyltransferase)
VVRRRARELGIDLGQVKGSGPEGRILSQDLQLQETVTLIPAGTQEEARAAEGSMPLSRLRVAIARTVAESWGTIPHFSVTVDVNMEATEGVRRQLKDCGIPVTLNDIVIKGVSLALKKFPRLNASFAADAIKIHDQFNIGVAVEIPEGVLVPVIPACQRLSLQEISSASCQLVDRARRGTLSEQEMSGGTFSISNLGMYGVSQFSAIIYPSQAAVLAVGVVDDVVIVRGGVPVCSRVMKVTLSADHRIVDGGYGAKFLTELKDILEKPVRLLI